ncbi:MAG: ribonuclease Y [Nitrospirota bacterium]
MFEIGYVLVALVAGLASGVALSLVYKSSLKSEWSALGKERQEMAGEAEKSAAALRREAQVEAKDIVYQAKLEVEKESRERQKELNQLEKRLRHKDELLEKKLDQVEKRDGELKKREREQNAREGSIREKEDSLEAVLREQTGVLERLSAMSAEEAKKELLGRVEEESRFEAAKLSKEIEDEARLGAAKKAQWVIGSAIQRYASDYIVDAAVSSVTLPSDDMKGRIIGREGRNIRALEAATGVDLIVDDTPEVVTLSAFDPVRREIARLSLERLISDGRIHPARIEEIVGKVTKEVESIIVEEGEKAVFDLGLSGVHPEMIKTAHQALERGDHEIEGSHSEIGARVAKKHGEKDLVVNAIAAHHGDVEASSTEAALVAASDALSAARPGVRSESIENYLKRLGKLEEMAMAYEGVEKCYAIQAGRELRIIVKPDDISDEMSWNIAKDLSKKIESEMTSPGQIKGTVVRESRYVEYAK